MDIEIIKKTDEPLLKRTYFEAKIIFDGKTPSRIDIIKDLCSKLGSKQNLTVVRKINSTYGDKRGVANGYSYEDEVTLKTIENKYVHLRHLTKQEQTAEKEKAKAEKQAAQPTSGGKKKK